MFDLITQATERPLRERSPRSKLVSVAVHAVVIPLAVALPILLTPVSVPRLAPTMLAFVAQPSDVTVPPPPPPPPRRAETPSEGAREARVAPRPFEAPEPAPVVAPEGVRGEGSEVRSEEGAGVAGGVEGGVEGGVVGGLVGSPASIFAGGELPGAPVPPPPPHPPVRIGGQVVAPALIHRVEPVYPALAIAGHITGNVIVEATVDVEGRVASVTTLSGNPALAKAALEAVRQWQYKPLTLDGVAVPFVLTVVLSFSLR